MTGKSNFRIDDKGRECTAPDCGEYKLWYMFHKQAGTGTGYSTVCKPCRSDMNAAQKAKNVQQGYSSSINAFCLGRGIEDHE